MNSELLKLDLNYVDPSEFTEIFLSILDKHTPKKQTFTQPNNSNFVTKNLRKPLWKGKNFETNIYMKERTKRKVSLINKEISAWVFRVKIRETISET